MAAPEMKQSGGWLTASGPVSANDATFMLARTILQGDASPASLAGVANYLDGSGTSAGGTLSGENFEERMHGAAYLTMAMPAFQLN
jgi:hypothetical protein